MHTVELIDGSEYACNEDREGVFKRRADGTFQQMVGTSDTPRFPSPGHMLQWIRANLKNRNTDDGTFPRVKRGSASGNWPNGFGRG